MQGLNKIFKLLTGFGILGLQFADNIDVTPGTGATIGGDLISSVLYQRVKLIHGIDGTNDGDVALTNPLPVSVSGGTITVNTISTTAVTQPTAANLNCVVSNGTISVNQATAANLNCVVSNGTLTVNTVSTVGITGTVCTTNLTAANFNVVVSNGTITVNTISTVGIAGTVGCVSLTAKDFNVVVSNGTLTVNTISTTAVTQATAANLNCVVSNGTITVNTISSVAITGTVSTTEASAASMLTALQIMDDWDDADKAKVVVPLRTTRFQGSLSHSDCTTAITVINGASTNSNLYITAYLISSQVGGSFWLEDGAATALTPKHFLASTGGVSFTCVDATPLGTNITATTIKLKSSVSGSVGCLVLGYSA